jgi:hypothetical protein
MDDTRKAKRRRLANKVYGPGSVRKRDTAHRTKRIRRLAAKRAMLDEREGADVRT